MASSQSHVVLEKGSLVVVTGVNGNIASHIADQLIKAGYRVRGTVRSKARGAWVVDHFDKKYGPGKIELAEVPDMSAEGAFNDAVVGASGFIHTATPVMESLDPNVAVPMVIRALTISWRPA